MVAAKLMTKEQVDELVNLARKDRRLWEEIKLRELESEKGTSDAAKQGLWPDDRDAVLDPPMLPTLETIVSDLIKARYGSDENFARHTLTMGLRRAARVDLGLPV